MMDIREMKAGRELDELVMIKVMRWTKEVDHKPLPMWRDNNGFNVDHIARFFTPSVDMSAAWEIIEKMNSPYVIASTEDGDESWVHFGDEANAAIGTAPEAICKAALLQMEGK